MVTRILAGRLNPRDGPPYLNPQPTPYPQWCDLVAGLDDGHPPTAAEKSEEKIHMFFMKWATIPLRKICHRNFFVKQNFYPPFYDTEGAQTVKNDSLLKG